MASTRTPSRGNPTDPKPPVDTPPRPDNKNTIHAGPSSSAPVYGMQPKSGRTISECGNRGSQTSTLDADGDTQRPPASAKVEAHAAQNAASCPTSPRTYGEGPWSPVTTESRLWRIRQEVDLIDNILLKNGNAPHYHQK